MNGTAWRRVYIRDNASESRSSILLEKHSTFGEVIDKIRDSLSLEQSVSFLISDIPGLNVSNENLEKSWIQEQGHWRVTWQRMLEHCEHEERSRMMVHLNIINIQFANRPPQVILDKLERGKTSLNDPTSRLKRQLDWEATLWVLLRTLQTQKHALNPTTIKRIVTLITPHIQNAIATTYCAYCIAMEVPTARVLSEVRDSNYVYEPMEVFPGGCGGKSCAGTEKHSGEASTIHVSNMCDGAVILRGCHNSYPGCKIGQQFCLWTADWWCSKGSPLDLHQIHSTAGTC